MVNESKRRDEISGGDIQAVGRAAQICALFGPGVEELSAAQVAESLGLNRTTAYRYCSSLASAGFLERGNARGTFMLGSLMLQLGVTALARRRVVDLAPSHLAQLSTVTHATAVLSLWGGNGPVVTRVAEDTRKSVFITIRQGLQLDGLAAQSRVFYAFGDISTARARFLDSLAPVERAQYEADLDDVRVNALSVVTSSDGLVGAAVPVFDSYGMCASMALLGTDRMGLEPSSIRVRALQDAARDLSREMGGPGSAV